MEFFVTSKIAGEFGGGFHDSFQLGRLWGKLREDSVERTFSKENERKVSQKMEFFVRSKIAVGFYGSFQLGRLWG